MNILRMSARILKNQGTDEKQRTISDGAPAIPGIVHHDAVAPETSYRVKLG